MKYVLDRWGHGEICRGDREAPPRSSSPASRWTSASPGPPVAQARPYRRPPPAPAGPVLRRRRAPGRPAGAPTRCAALAEIADRHGSGTIRLTVWQNLLISDIPEEKIPAVQREIERARRLTGGRRTSGAAWWPARATSAASSRPPNTKRHAMAIADHLDARLELDAPDQHPRDRLPQFVRPALHRRHRPAWDRGRSRRRHGRGLPHLPRRRLRRRAGRRPRNLPRASRPTEAPAVIERMLRGYLAHR